MGPLAKINNVLNGPFYRYFKLSVCPFSIGWMIAQQTILPLLATLNGHMKKKLLLLQMKTLSVTLHAASLDCLSFALSYQNCSITEWSSLVV